MTELLELKKPQLMRIIFSQTKSRYYPIAIDVAERFEGYKKNDENTHEITILIEDFIKDKSITALLKEFPDTVWKLSTVNIFVDEEKLIKPPKELINCITNSIEAYNPEDYCYSSDAYWKRNDFGCKHCGIYPYNYNGLENLGYIDQNGDYIVDKEKLAYKIYENIKKNYYYICPRLNLNMIKNYIMNFPEKINPKINTEWEYLEKSEYQDNQNKKYAIGIRKKQPENLNNFVVEDNRDNDNGENSNMTGSIRLPIEKIESLEEKLGIELNITAFMNKYDDDYSINIVGEIVSDSLKSDLEVIANVYNINGEIIATGSNTLYQEYFIGIESFKFYFYDIPISEEFGKLRIYPKKR